MLNFNEKPWRITLFGPLRLHHLGVEVDLPSLTKARSLVAFLALNAGQSFTREQLIDVLWQDEDLDECRARLRRCVYELRGILNSAFETNRLTVRIAPDVVAVDAIEFMESLSAASQAASLPDKRVALERAVSLYSGDLFTGFYEQHFLNQQREFAARRIAAISELATLCEQSSDLESASRFIRMVIATDPLAEENYSTLMRLASLQGHPSEVLKTYQDLERVLRDELGEEPTSAMRLLMLSYRKAAQEVAAIQPVSNNGNHVRTVELNGFVPRGSSANGTIPAPARRQIWSDRRLTWTAAILVVVIAFAIGVRAGRQSSAQSTGTAVDAHPSRNQKPLWVAVYDSQPGEMHSEPTAMTTDSHGNIYVTGFIRTKDHDVDFITLKYDPNGKLLWKQPFNGTGNDLDRAKAIALDSEGNVYVTGESANEKGNNDSRLSYLDIVTIKYNSEGKELWKKRWNSEVDGEDRPYKIRIDRRGFVYVVGVSGGKLWDGKRSGYCPIPIILKYDGNGVLYAQITRTTDQHHQGTFRDVAIDADGNIFAAGDFMTDKYGIRNNDVRIDKFSPGGELLWEKQVSSKQNGDDKARLITIDSHSNIVVAGETYSGSYITGGSEKDILLVSYDPDGNERWRKSFDGTHGDDSPEGMAVDSAGSVVIAGWTTNLHKQDFLALKFDSSGKEQWRQTYNGNGNFDDNAYAIAVDPKDMVAVTGRVHNGTTGARSGTDWDYFTMLIEPSGEIHWWSAYDHSRNADIACAVGFDPQGNVIVTGQSQSGPDYPRIVTIKYPR